MTEQELKTRRVRAAEARQFMESPMFAAMFDGVGEALEAQAVSCDPDNKDKAQRVIIAKQILAGMRREIERLVDDGEFAHFQLKELETRRGLLQRVMQR